MSGLLAAQSLQAGGREILVLDKGRGFGGRMAGRNFAGATFEHGAQFLEARTPRFTAQVEAWCRAGLAEKWYLPLAEVGDAPFRFRAKPSMTALARYLATGIELLRVHTVVSLGLEGNRWSALLDKGGRVSASAVLVTCPVPQSLALLDQGGFAISSAHRTKLASITYERCLTVMAVLEGPSRLPSPGILAQGNGPIDRLCDHQIQGASPRPAVTIQAGHQFSLDNWDRPRQEVAAEILKAAQPWLGSPVAAFQIHGWRYCRPLRSLANTCLKVHDDPSLVFAGDAFGGCDLESAAHSGWAAAASI